jgi:hypothetical protein
MPMAYSMRRRILFTALIMTGWVAQLPAARADQCALSCAIGQSVCVTQARIAAKACLRGCGSDTTTVQCRAGCVRTFLDSQAGCRAASADCGTACPTPLAAADTCSATCSDSAQACFADALRTGRAYLRTCPAGTARPGCWQQGAVGLRSSGATCLATFQGCLAACQGPVSGACFDTIALQCTAEACGPGQACSQPNEFCSPRCAAPQPSGTCFDPSTMECTQQPCSSSQPCAQANQTCVPECPGPPPKGKCFDTASKQCTDQPCVPGASCGAPNLLCTLQCSRPLPTPTPQCSSLPCGGQCVISPPCPAGGPCPEIASLLGQCALDSAGSCRCVPPSAGPTRTPPPTATPQCSSRPCGGDCVISQPCPPGAVCPEIPILLGHCTLDPAGTCQCEPPTPGPTRTPPPTATPQCGSQPCGGDCVISPSCPPGGACPNFALMGECRDDGSGTCQCMPITAPTQTPSPACTADADCNDGDTCTIDHCVNGTCEHVCVCLTSAGASACCPGPAALCARPCGTDVSGSCGGTCPPGATCETLPTAQASCGCVSEVGGPCGGNIFAPPPVCAPGLVCQQSLPDVTGVCVKPTCIPFFAAGCTQTSDCCQPCGSDTRAPCAVCSQGTCVGTP